LQKEWHEYATLQNAELRNVTSDCTQNYSQAFKMTVSFSNKIFRIFEGKD